MEARVEGKVALVTGATQGIGLAIAQTLGRAGAAGILIAGRDEKRGLEAVRAIEALGCAAGFVAAELAEPEAPNHLVAACLARFGRLDLLANAAGLTDRASLLDADIAVWNKLFDVNARAPFFLMQAAVKAMRERGEGGAIVNILSMNAHCGTPELAVYSATKAALSVLTRNTAHAHLADRIRVNGINVGWADTPAERVMQAQTLGHGEGWLDAANRAAPFGRLLSAQDVANLAVFLLSDASGPMSGALIDQEQWVLGSKP